MILKPLQRIQVISSEKKCKAGSLGYFVSQDYRGKYNMWDMCGVFTRFGKKGKPRVEILPIRTIIVDYSGLEQSDRDILDIVKFYDGLVPRPGYNEIENTEIIPIPIEAKNILDLPDNEFKAYIVALSLVIYKAIYNAGSANLNRLPPLSFQMFADSGYDLSLVSPETVGYYIIIGMRSDVQRRKYRGIGTTFETSYTAQTDTRLKKEVMLNRLQLALAMSKIGIKKYNDRVAEVFSHVSEFTEDTIKYYKRNKKDLTGVQEIEKDRKNYHPIPRVNKVQRPKKIIY